MRTAPELRGVPYKDRPKSETALWNWLRREKVAMYSFAKLIRCSEIALSRWVYNWTLPELVYAFRIEQATKGEVPVASWLGTELGKLEWERVGFSVREETVKARKRDIKFKEKRRKLKEIEQNLTSQEQEPEALEETA